MANATNHGSGSAAPRSSADAVKDDFANVASSVKKLANEQLGSAAETIQQTALEKANDLELAIRKKPAQAALIAAGVGFLVGLILTR